MKTIFSSYRLHLDLLSTHPLHPPCAAEERPLLHRSADDSAHHPVCVRDVSSALHEDGLPPSDDTLGPCQVRRLRPTERGHRRSADLSLRFILCPFKRSDFTQDQGKLLCSTWENNVNILRHQVKICGTIWWSVRWKGLRQKRKWVAR